MASELDAFLAEGQPGQEPTPTPAPQPEAPPAPPAEPAPTPAPATEPPDDDAPDEAAERIESQGKSYIPQEVLERERHRRQDWKARALKGEQRATDLQKQLDEVNAAARQPPPQQQPLQQRMMPPAPDAQTDPVGYANWQQRERINMHLNFSELVLRDRMGDAVDGYIEEFQQMMAADPTLQFKLYSQRHPYGWMVREVDNHRALREIGSDPAAWRARVEAEARVKWDAEQAAVAPPPPPPIPVMQPSLANVRSVAGRTAQQWTGEPTLEDVLAPVQNRKRPNGAAPVRF